MPIVPHSLWCCQTLSGPFGSWTLSAPYTTCIPWWLGWWILDFGGRQGWEQVQTTGTMSSTFAMIPSTCAIFRGQAIGLPAYDRYCWPCHPISDCCQSAIQRKVVALALSAWRGGDGLSFLKTLASQRQEMGHANNALRGKGNSCSEATL
jgi:hypothetical protein